MIVHGLTPAFRVHSSYVSGLSIQYSWTSNGLNANPGERVTSLIPIVGVVLGSPAFWIKPSSLLFFSWVPSLTQGWAPDRIRGKIIFPRLLDKEPQLICSVQLERM